MALHQQCVGATSEWYTPEYVFRALGCQFEMDVASPGDRRANGLPGKSPAQGTCLMAIGDVGYAALRRAAKNGLGILLATKDVEQPA